MKLYCFYTDSYQVLLDDWFLPSIKDSCEVVLKKSAFQGGPIPFKNEGWSELMCEKVEKIIEAIHECWGSSFIYSDPDVQFFQEVVPDIEAHLKNNDLVIQRDGPDGDAACAGFFAMKGNKKTLRLWQDIRDRVIAIKGDDQTNLHVLLERETFLGKCMRRLFMQKLYRRMAPRGFNRYGICWDFLPIQFLSGGGADGKDWKPGLTFVIPDEVKMHHANWTVGLENKLIQLKHVRSLVENQQLNLK